MPQWLLYVGSFVIVLGVIIFVHELGHFTAAKAVGIHVHRFSLGIGAPIPWLTARWGETEYCISWLPLGGYVKMAGMGDDGAMAQAEGGPIASGPPVSPERAFDKKPLPARALVISAGVIMNFVFAMVVYAVLAATVGRAVEPTTQVDSVIPDSLPRGAQSLLSLERGDRITSVNGRAVTVWNDIEDAFLGGGDSLVLGVDGKPALILPIPGTDVEGRIRALVAMAPLPAAAVGAVAPRSPADRAGVAAGDTILAIDGDSVRSWVHMASLIRPRAGDTLTIALLRNGAVREVLVVPEAGLLADPSDTAAAKRGAIGVSWAVGTRRVREPPLRAIQVGVLQTVTETGRVLRVLQGLLLRDVSPRQLGGPIMIGQMSGQVAQLGVASLVAFMALLSINIGVLNLLPIPVLDGGHLVFLGIEGLRGRPLAPRVRGWAEQVGMFLLVALVLWAFWSDINRLLGR